MNDYLTRVSIMRLLAVMLLVLAPHAMNIRKWMVLFVLCVLGWRWLAAVRQWALPPTLPRALLTLLAGVGVYASFGSINGQNAGTALLVLMTALKLLEMRSRRDVMVTVILLYFVLVTHFLFSQELWTILYLLVCAVAITAFLIEANHSGDPLPLKQTLRMGSKMVALALPLMLVMFVLFPRIPGPLWGLPADSGAERSGLPDSMSPGNIAKLILSEEISFRVKFEGAAPPMRERYWRGPVFDQFDGRSWKSGERFVQDGKPEATYEGQPIQYEVTLEPTRTSWLMALDLPSPSAVPLNAYINSDHQLVLRTAVRDRMLYRTASYPRYQLQPDLLPRQRAQHLRLPRYGNVGTHTLAQNWRAEGLNDEQIIARALRMYRDEPFYYTLQPPALGEDSIDDFLFRTRKGFCEHYASSFVFLMRAANIPARVVTGFHGGEKNEFGDYYIVRQSDAHAWSEVWLEGSGWRRVDPTAQVAPERIENGISGSLGAELPAFLNRSSGSVWLTLNARWDWVNNKWNSWVLAYGPELQAEFLSKFGIEDWSGMIVALTIIGMIMLALIGGLMLRQFRPADTSDAALKLWKRALKILARQGLAQRPHEGPQHFALRVAEEEPHLAAPMQLLVQAYLNARYLQDESPERLHALKQAVTQLKRKPATQGA